MTIKNGRFDSDSTEEILDAMISDAKGYFGEDLHDTDLAVVRLFYRPIARRLAEAQQDISLVLDSSQLEHAEGQALDLVTALVGVSRNPPESATGEVQFTRDSLAGTSYTIPSGTTVQTQSNDPVRFETTETTAIDTDQTQTTVPIEAVEPGVAGNVGSNTITQMPNTPTGVDSVTNPNPTEGGSEEESDQELRNRTKNELAEGSRASASALINSVQKVDGVSSVTVLINDGLTDQIGTGTDRGFEVIAAGGDSASIADVIESNKAAGDTSFGGENGTVVTETVTLPNGQTIDINFSRPTETQIHVSADVEVTSEYEGNEEVQDEVVSYLGGLLNSGQTASGLDMGEDVIYGEIEYAIRSIEGVHDVTTLEIGTSDPPGSTSNIAVSNTEVAYADATDGTISLTTTTI